MTSICLWLSIAGAHAQSKLLTIKMKHVPLEQAIVRIEEQSRYLFLLSRSVDVKNKIVSVDAENKPIREVLDRLLRGTQLTYNIEGTNILVSKLAPESPVELRGTIRDSAGNPIPGATVVVKGTTIGASTQSDGSFSLRVPPTAGSAQLEISYLGYETLVVSVGSRTSFDVTIRESASQIESVVVTALGIKRAEKALSYNVQQIGSDAVTAVKDANFVNALAGKVAGVVINASSSGVGGASRVVMRGNKAISADKSNNALFVIDGIPVFNLGPDAETEHGSRGATDPLADINPEDIESVSVLTGAAAAALYGSNAANGAIIVNTRRGVAGKTTVRVSSGIEVSAPFAMPEFQNRYGTGDYLSENGSTYKSWGDRLRGEARTGYDPEKDFFQTGVIYTNNVSFATGNNRNQTYFSAGVVNADGIVPNNIYDRYNFTIRNTSQFLNDKMTLDLGASYILQKDQNMINQGVYSNPIVSAYLFPRGDDFDNVRIFERYNASRKISEQFWPAGEGGDLRMQNPYWVAYRNLRNTDKKRYMMNAHLSYDLLPWLNLTGRVRIDNTNSDHRIKLYATTIAALANGSNGALDFSKREERQIYADAMANINKTFGNFSLVANVGASITDAKMNQMQVSGPIDEEQIPNVFDIKQLDKAKMIQQEIGYREQTQSLFASVEVGYKGMFYLTATGRFDWASALANTPQMYFFYPSVGASAILSEIVALPDAINYLKLRGSYSSVGLPPARGITSLTFPWNKSGQIWDPISHYPVGRLYPEKTNSFEIGLTARIAHCLDIDLSFYNAVSSKQTFDPDISPSAGYTTIYVQSGEVRNRGVELSLGYKKSWNKFSWSANYTLSVNRNKINKLLENYVNPVTGELISLDHFDMRGHSNAHFLLRKGGGMGDLYSMVDLQRDSNGNVYLDYDGNVSTNPAVDPIYLGSVYPKANMGFQNSFNWKGIGCSFLLSARLGGIVYSATQANMDYAGVSGVSAQMRDRGGVAVNANQRVDANKWYSVVGATSGVPQYYTYSATNVKLQEARIGYTIPREKLGGILDITVSLVGRNLWMIYNKAPFDPESVATPDGFYQGIDYFMLPGTRNIGFNVRLQF